VVSQKDGQVPTLELRRLLDFLTDCWLLMADG
jgi:hypothetical protein